MKAALATILFASLSVAVFAGSSDDTPYTVVCYQDSLTFHKAMWTSEAAPITGEATQFVGGSTCMSKPSSGWNKWYKGVCDNTAGTYTITQYEDNACTTATPNVAPYPMALSGT